MPVQFLVKHLMRQNTYLLELALCINGRLYRNKDIMIIHFLNSYRFFFILTLLCLNFSGSKVSAQEENTVEPKVRIGVVDRQKIMQDSLAGESVRKEFEAMEKAYREEIGARENELRAQQEELGRQRAILTPEAYSERENEFATLVEGLQRDVAKINKQLDAMLQYGMRQIDIQTIQIIAEIAEAKGYTLVLDKTQLLMVNTDYEFSQEVLTVLNARLPVVEITLIEETAE
ncbi:MAG: hypothetical protein CMM32_11845 [Rhodospirillaceae bacterium]|nr:hypothetical protein [Rhodospirillaceae bacterium]